MNRSVRNMWKKGTAILLAIVLILSDLSAASAAELGEQKAVEDPMKSNLMKAVYAALDNPGESASKHSAATAPVTTVAANASLSWNLLSKVDRSLIPTLYYNRDNPELKLSTDGRYIGFNRLDLAADQSQLKQVLSVYDRVTGVTDNVYSAEVPILANQILRFDISGDARYVAFSYAEGIHLPEPRTSVYLFDRETRMLTAITGNTGKRDFDDDTDMVSISADGQYVAFDSNAAGLVPEDTDDLRDVFVYDRESGSIQRISTRVGMKDNDYGDSNAPSISWDGRYIAFQTDAKLVDDDSHDHPDIYVYDREGGNAPFQRVSAGLNGEEADGRSSHPSISDDGQVIAYESEARNLVVDDTNDLKDIFVYDKRSAMTKRVSIGAGGIPFSRDSEQPAISDDGLYVGFQLAYEAVDETDTDSDNDDENDFPKEAYVADVAAQMAERVSVQNAPYRLVNPSMGPVVGRGGSLVVYFSEYWAKFDGTDEFKLPGIFIAAKGTVPVWPAGSQLQPSNRTVDSVTLSWQDATDPKGILGYHVYQDGKIIGYVPYGGTGGSFTASGLLPTFEHLFQIEAVNTDYHESYGGPTYKLDAGGGTPGDTLQIGWDAEKTTVMGLPMAGSKLNFFAYGNPGKQITGELTYKTWKDDSTEETHKLPLTLTERAASPGKYEAVWGMAENTSEITSLTMKMTDPESPGTVTEKQAFDLPVQVTGTAVIAFDNPGSGSLKDGILSLSSGQYGEQVTILTGDDPVSLEGLVPDKDYTIVLRSPDFRHIWAKQEQLKVGAGRKKSFTLAIEQPAKLRFQVIDQTGQPAANVQMQLFDEEQNYLGMTYTRSDGWTDWEEGLKVGTTIVAKVDIGDRLVEPVPDQRVKLIPGANEPKVILKAPGEGVLEGVVTAPNGSPVKNAFITATQMFRGKPIVRNTRTNLDGAYRLSLLEGEAKLELYESAYHYSAGGIVTAQIAEGQTTKLNIPVRQPSTGVINLEVRLKYLEDSDFGEPVNLEQLGFHTVIESKFGHMPGGYMSGYFSNAYHFGGLPGQKVSVCVTSSKPAIMTVCDEVTLDENSNATAKLFFEEKGGRIQGKLAKTDHRWINGRIYKLVGGSKTSSRYVGDDDFSEDGTFDINVPEPGTYLMELARRPVGDQVDYEYANVQFTVADKQILPIGTVTFGGKKYFSNYAGNHYDALSSRVLPGGTVSFRAGFNNRNDSEATGVSLIFDIPEGMTPVKDAGGRIVISGAATEGDARLEGQSLIVPIGTLAKKQSGTIGFQVKVDPAFNQRSLKTSAIIRAKIGTEQVEETIGSIQLDVPLVTLEVPERVFSPIVKLSGVAPSGSTVKVYDGKALIGSAPAAVSGVWSLEAELNDLGDPSTHALRAETEAGGVTLQSPVSYISYDTKKPRLLEVAMSQAPDGRWVTLNTREGISRLAYTVRPGNPFQFDLKFDKPDEVENVYIYLDGQTGDPIKAVRDGNFFHAVTPTGRGALGDIYVDYDTKPEPFVNDGRYPSLEEVRQSLPPTMHDFKLEVKSPFELKNGKYSGTVQFIFPQLKDLKATVTLTIGLNSGYKATKEELEMAERSGLPILNATFGATETEDGFKTVSKGHIPMNVLFPNGVPEGLTASLAAGDVQTFDDPVLTDVTTETFVQFGPGGEEFGKINGIKKQYSDTMGFAEKVMKITGRVESFGMDCIAELPKTVKQAGHALKSLVVGEVTKFGLGAWTAAMGLTGPGAIAAAGATAVAGQQIDNYVDSQIDAIGTGYNQCLDEEVDEKKLKRKKIARPRWIYDPSGYIYEAVPTNRLSGVKATVLYKDPVSQEWTVWDAGPYEQVNPHNTDDQGKYGWDVPEGKWKVVWEKEGYETKTSAELDVPPPHTEVNAGLVSWESPKVQTVTGVTYGGGGYMDIQFSKYVKVPSNIQAQAVTVTGPDGQEVEGTLSFVKPELNPADPAGQETLSTTLRFTPKDASALKVGSDYALKVKANLFQSYAGVWMREGHAGRFTVSLRDEAGPVPTSATVDEGGMILSLTFNEPLGAAIDASKIDLNGNAEAIASVVRSAAAGGNHTLLISLTEPLPAGETTLKVLGGAATDAAGNVSSEQELKVSRQAAGTNSKLSALSIAGGVLSPDFDPERLSYTVKVSQTAEDIQVTAVTADSKAKLTVDGVEAVSGTAKSVRVPDKGDIAIRVTAEDGQTVREYTIEVKREANPPSTDATLSALTLSSGTLTPAFHRSTTAYSVELPVGTTELGVTAAVYDAKSKLTIGGAAAESGVTKVVTIPNDKTIRVAVESEAGATKEYTIEVKHPVLSENNELRALTLSNGTLTPAFNPATTAYSVELPTGTTELGVTAAVYDAKSKLTIGGVVAVSGVEKIVTIPNDKTIRVIVEAESGATKEYTIEVKHPVVSENNDLRTLALSNGTLTPAFNPATTAYSVELPAGTTDLGVTAAVYDAKSKLTIGGAAAVSGVSKIVTIPNDKIIRVVVESESGATKEYTIEVKHPVLSENNDLRALTLSNGTLTPAFNPATTAYSVELPTGTTELGVTAAVYDAKSKLTIGGVVAVSGVEKIVTIPNDKTIRVVVESESGATKEYTIEVKHPVVSENNDLRTLALSNGTLTPAFNPATTAYSVELPAGTTDLGVTATVYDAKSKLTIGGAAAVSGVSKIVTIPNDKIIRVVVEAESGATKEYTIEVKHPVLSENNDLRALTLSNGTLTPAFNPATTAYSVELPTGTTELGVTAAVYDAKSKLTIGGAAAESGVAKIVTIPNDKIIRLVVESESGATKEYTIEVKHPFGNNNLRALTLSNGTLTPAFNPATTAYSVELPTGTTELGVTAAVYDAKSKLTIGGAAAVSGVSKIVTIPNDKIIRLVVESESGATNEYTIQVSYTSNNDPDSPDTSPGSAPAPAAKDPLNLGETAVKEKKKASSGGTALVIDIGKDAVTEALKDGKKSKELYVEANEPLDEIILQLPIDALHQLESAQAVLLVKTQLMNVRLNAAALQTSGLAEGTTIRLVIAKAEDQLAKAAAEASRKQNEALKMITGSVIVLVQAVTGGSVTPISLSAKNALQGEFAELKGGLPDVYRYDAASQSWIYVRSQKNADGKGLKFDISTTDSYAAMIFANGFEDMVGHWAKQDIEWLARRLLVNGVSTKEFRPEGSVTRAEFTAMLIRALAIPVSDTTSAVQFTDVDREAWYYKSVMAAASKGLVNGLDPGVFAPNETITREQMAVMIGRAYQILGLGSTSTTDTAALDKFVDSGHIQAWAKGGVALVLKERLMQGVTDETFEPAGITTRAQAAIVIGRLLKKQE
ncbi:cadherin-like beta sandwich domain-containing protein [Paenibacillus sedimenti]|uniref:Cadherin-like beta sandwich domain-containing protein n=1 Tax=Paenibacillus sedimenti TaxID=2770274 RepID=A0A926KXE0_9BACL|nr:cadherin-like beta sandwich domain-containing protein [Paenibacillus sedimenti]MBD0383993.1 cadherin-like beta sandwich domain-containing protein [Paenibacillus sedimenti]